VVYAIADEADRTHGFRGRPVDGVREVVGPVVRSSRAGPRVVHPVRESDSPVECLEEREESVSRLTTRVGLRLAFKAIVRESEAVPKGLEVDNRSAPGRTHTDGGYAPRQSPMADKFRLSK